MANSTSLQQVRKAKVKRGKRITALNARVAERRFKVLGLRVKGLSYQEIADELKLDYSTVAYDCKAVLKDTIRINAETTEELRDLQGLRLDKIVNGHMQYASEPYRAIAYNPRTQKNEVVMTPPNQGAANIVLQAEQRRSKLFGLDTPELKTGKTSGIRLYVGVDMDEL